MKLKGGEITGGIYKKTKKSSDDEMANFVTVIDTVDNYLRESLYKLRVGNIFDISKGIGLENVGIGWIMTSALFGNLIAMSQKEAWFYFVTEINKKITIRLNLLAIPKISGRIKFEDIIVETFSISTLSEYTISLEIKPELVKKKLSRISIITDRCWSPKYLDSSLPDFPLGVGVRLIEAIPN